MSLITSIVKDCKLERYIWSDDAYTNFPLVTKSVIVYTLYTRIAG